MDDIEFNAIFRSIGEELEGYSLYGTYVDLSDQSEQGDDVSSNF